jgi:hypothetical protein
VTGLTLTTFREKSTCKQSYIALLASRFRGHIYSLTLVDRAGPGSHHVQPGRPASRAPCRNSPRWRLSGSQWLTVPSWTGEIFQSDSFEFESVEKIRRNRVEHFENLSIFQIDQGALRRVIHEQARIYDIRPLWRLFAGVTTMSSFSSEKDYFAQAVNGHSSVNAICLNPGARQVQNSSKR